MTMEPREPVVENGSERRGDGGARAVQPRPRWARLLRRVLLYGIALLYAASIPWYRGDAPTEMILGLPDWVAVAILCYAAAAILNFAAWMLTDIPESIDDDEARRT
jgi:hypothetical protein